jgi:hypothetical protein
MKFNSKLSFAAAALFVLVGAQQSRAGTVTLVNLGTLPATTTGTLAQEDDVIEASFTLSAPSSIMAYTTSYSGGANLTGPPSAAGGFEPMLTLYSNSGNYLVGENLQAGDASLTDSNLAAGTYILTLTDFLTQQSAFATNLSDGFTGPGGSNFIDDQGASRTGNYALNLSVTPLGGTGPGSAAPEPATFWLFVPTLIGAGLFMRKRRALKS